MFQKGQEKESHEEMQTRQQTRGCFVCAEIKYYAKNIFVYIQLKKVHKQSSYFGKKMNECTVFGYMQPIYQPY